MGFLSDLVDSTPVLGHGKGLYHYACGEKEKGDEAMYQSTRTSAVIGGGIIAGPAGAMGAGLATDATASLLMNKEKGLINSCKDIGEDIEAKRNPMRSIASAGLQLGLDGISGYGGSSRGVSNASRRVVGKTMQRGGEQVIQKSVKISSVEAAKMVARKSSERTAAKAAQRGFLLSAHVGLTAAQRTELEERERREREWEERKREREWRKRERKRRERDQKERELREREWREQEREQREREWREQEQREREWREQEQREREWREQEQREREWREQEQREREWREQEQREREWREQEQREREWREREQREREWSEREREQRERQQQKSKKQEECKKREQRANSEKQKRDTSGSRSGSSQPPQGNKDNNKKREEKNEPSFFETFMTLLRRILKIVYGNESEPFSSIFENLPKEQRKYLSKVLKPLMGSGTLEVVIELVIRMFKQYFHQDISFLNFLSLLEFVQTYITDELLERTRISSGTETAETKMKPKERREKIISEIASEKDINEKLIELFKKLKTEIEAETAAWNTVFPNFRDIFAAVYHYFKHRKVPDNGRILSVKEYYDWIKKFLEELKQTQKFTELKDSKVQNYVHEIFVPIFCRRFRIVLKLHGDNILLSSAFVVTMLHPDDEKHVVFIAGQFLTNVFIAIGLFYCTAIILLNTPLIVSTCITFTVKLLLNTLLFFIACFIFILKVLLNILLIFICLWFLFSFLPDA